MLRDFAEKNSISFWKSSMQIPCRFPLSTHSHPFPSSRTAWMASRLIDFSLQCRIIEKGWEHFFRKIKDQSIDYSDRLEAARTSEELRWIIDMMTTVIQSSCRSLISLQSRWSLEWCGPFSISQEVSTHRQSGVRYWLDSSTVLEHFQIWCSHFVYSIPDYTRSRVSLSSLPYSYRISIPVRIRSCVVSCSCTTLIRYRNLPPYRTSVPFRFSTRSELWRFDRIVHFRRCLDALLPRPASPLSLWFHTVSENYRNPFEEVPCLLVQQGVGRYERGSMAYRIPTVLLFPFSWIFTRMDSLLSWISPLEDHIVSISLLIMWM